MLNPTDLSGPASVLPPRISAWRVYFFAVASFGLYIPFWVYRSAGAVSERPRPVRIAWAFASLIPLVGWALLYDFQRQAGEAAKGQPLQRPASRVFPSVLFLVFYFAVGFSPLQHFLLAPLFLLPIPFALVQRTINRAARSHEPPIRTIRAPRWVWAPALAGLLAVTGTTAWLLPGALQQFRPRQRVGAIVVGNSGSFEVRIPGAGWRSVESGTMGDAGSDLELVGPGAETWAVAYALSPAETNLDQTVSQRRSMIFEQGTPLTYEESRFFLQGSDFVVASIASYTTDFGLGIRGTYYVMTTELENHVVELIGYTANAGRYLGDLEGLVLSLRERMQGREPDA